MKIGILLCGLAQPRMANKHGYYDQQFRDMLEPLGFHCQTFAVVANQLPAADDDCDGYLISGSAHNLDAPLPWTQPLLAWIQSVFGKKPLVGICFGHQAIAAAMGGQVADADVVYQTGVIQYTGNNGNTMNVAAWHGQQVLTLPPVELEVTFSAEHCPVAGIRYVDKALSYQSHPEFTDEYIADLYDTHYQSLTRIDHQFYENKLDSIQVDHNIGEEIAEFYRRNA